MSATHPYFVPDGDSRQDTAILLVGTARDHDLDQRCIRTVQGGFRVSDALADLIYGATYEMDEAESVEESGGVEYDPADYTVAQVKEFLEEHPDLTDDILAAERAGKNRASLVGGDTDASGDRAAKDNNAVESDGDSTNDEE